MKFAIRSNIICVIWKLLLLKRNYLCVQLNTHLWITTLIGYIIEQYSLLRLENIFLFIVVLRTNIMYFQLLIIFIIHYTLIIVVYGTLITCINT